MLRDWQNRDRADYVPKHQVQMLRHKSWLELDTTEVDIKHPTLTTEDLERIRCQQQTKRFKNDLEHSCMFQVFWGFGLEELLTLIREKNGYFKEKMLNYGGLLFRNFPIHNEHHFAALKTLMELKDEWYKKSSSLEAILQFEKRGM